MDDFGHRSWGESILASMKPLLPTIRPLVRASRGLAEFRVRAQQNPALRALLNDAISYLLYTFALTDEMPQIWCLTPSAYQALSQTAAPAQLFTELPHLPGKSIYLTFPAGEHVPVPNVEGGTIAVSSILLVEEVEGRIWRYIGFDDKVAAYTVIAFGFLDLAAGPLAQQLADTYAPQGHNVIWNLVLNLATALRHPGYLGTRRVKPAVPAHGHKRTKFLRKRRGETYTVVDLTAPTGRADSGRARSTQRQPVQRHLVRGHWRRLTVNEPREDAIIESTVIEDGKTRYRVLLWILPHWRGAGEPEAPVYKVIAPQWRERRTPCLNHKETA
jgi:hypothetical protein